MFDLYYLTGEVNQRTLRKVLRDLVLQNKKCPIREPLKILEAVGRTFKSKRFVRDMSAAKANWLKLPPTKVTAGVLAFLQRMLIG